MATLDPWSPAPSHYAHTKDTDYIVETKAMSTTTTSTAKKASGVIDKPTAPQRKQHGRELKFVTAQVGTKRRKKTKAPYAARTHAGMFSKFTLDTETRRKPVESPPKLPNSPAGSGCSSTPKSSSSSGHEESEQWEQWDQGDWSMPNAGLPLYGGFVFPPEQLPEGFFGDDHEMPLEPTVVDDITDLSTGASPVSSTYNGFDISNYEDPVNDDILDFLRQIPTGVTYQNLAHKYHDVLESYNTNYCVVPLSTDCPSNPFRISPVSFEKYPFLLHGVLAISSRHLAKRDKSVTLEDQAHSHWSTSLQLLSTATYSNSDFLPLLDTVLVLANFESMQSAYNMVNMHLDGAEKMLQEAGLSAWTHYSPRLRAQIAMLVWWDVTVSLVARRKPRLPAYYMDTLVNYDGDESDGWSSFTLNGCPLAFITAMSRLANLAAIYEQTKLMEHTLFDHSAVEAILKQVEDFADIDDPMYSDTAGDADTIRTRHHCIEAWRHAILLYAARVFKPAPDKAALKHINHLSRVILDSARCIPPTETLQKQVLLPVFLASAEAGNEWNRDFAREYCRHWNKTSNFDQFETVGRLLEEIWGSWTEDTRDVYWWGVKVPAAGIGGVEAPMARMLQLG